MYWTNGNLFHVIKSHKKDFDKTYGKSVPANKDIVIVMKINLKKRNISFEIDNVDQGIAFNDIEVGDKLNYRMAVILPTSWCDLNMSIITFKQRYQ